MGRPGWPSAHRPGSPGWPTTPPRSFSFRSPAGAYTARKERRQRGGAYWVAYRTAAGRQHKVYLGKAEELTPERLDEAAAALAGRVTGAGEVPGRWAGAASACPCWRPSCSCPGPAPTWSPGRGCWPASTPAWTRAGARCCRRRPGPARPACWPPGWPSWTARSPGSPSTSATRTPHQVLRYLIAALQTIAPACGRTALAWLDAPPPPPPEVVLTGLVNDLAALPAPGLLVLDDYHLVRAPPGPRRGRLPARPPAADPAPGDRQPRGPAAAPAAPARPPPAHRGAGGRPGLQRRGGGRASWATAWGCAWPEAQVAALVDRTEGWAAGLQLAGLALRDRPDPAAFVAAFTGGHRLVADYLLAEVLDRQPAPTRRFLLATGVLDRLCAPLCDAVLAPDAADAQRPREQPGDPGGAGAGQPVPGAAGRRADLVPLPPPVRRRPAGPAGPGGRPRRGGRPPPAGRRLVRPPGAAAGGDRPRAGRRRRRGRGDLDRGR